MTEEHHIADYAQASRALKEKNFRQALYDEGAVVMQDVLVNLHGDEHRRRRKLETAVFRRDFFRYYETEVFPETLTDTLAPYVADGAMDLVDFGYRAMVNLTADFAGIDRPLKSPEETADLMALLRLFGKTATLAHATVDREAVRQEAHDALKRFDETYIAPSINNRKQLLADFNAGRISEAELPRDILTVLLRNEDGIELPRDVLTREMAFFALAGAHTSIHTLTHAVHELLSWTKQHPADLQRVKNDRRFIQQAVLESIRLHPSSPIAARRSLCPVSLSHTEVAEGDAVIIDLQSANRSTEIFGADANEFNPLRELPRGQVPHGLSFGQGMHACLGLNLAAGTLPAPGEPVVQMGTVALIVEALFARGMQADPDREAQKDASTARDLWGFYPVIFKR